MIDKKILIVCNDVIGPKMAGPAIRCVEIAKVLSRHFIVKLYASKVQGNFTFPFEVYEFSSAKRFRLDADVADIIIVQGSALRAHPFLKKTKAVLIADLYCPIPLEYHQASSGVNPEVRAATGVFLSDVLREQLAFADHFLCASERQREFWLGALMLTGRVNSLRWPEASDANISDLISLLPFGLSSERPQQQRPALRSKFNIPFEDLVLVWGGGLYQWFDPLTPIRAVHKLVSSGRRVHLVFLGVKHPNPNIAEHDMSARAVSLATELELINQFVHFNFDWVNYDDRHNYLLDADVGISAHFDNPETRFSFRTRMLDYLWCGLPIIATRGDFFGDKLDAQQIGISVDFKDEAGWVRAIESIITEPQKLKNMQTQVSQYSEQYRWETLIGPLVERCKNITVSADRVLIRKSYTGADRSGWLSSRLRRAYTSGGIQSVFHAFFRWVRRCLG